jgi:hypothetical protein
MGALRGGGVRVCAGFSERSPARSRPSRRVRPGRSEEDDRWGPLVSG